jgi:two-component system chemotaxis response regulator CheB
MAFPITRPAPTTRRLPEGAVEVSEPSAIDVVAIAGSLGGPEAVRQILAGLPKWFPAPLLVVQHRTTAAQLLTVELLGRSTELVVKLAIEGDAPRPGWVHVMPADRDLVIGPTGRFAGARMQGHRLPADELFSSVAAQFGHRSVGVVLSGTNADAAQGVVAIKRAGGCVIAQNRATARCFAMPAAAIATGCVDLVLPVDRLAHLLVGLAAWPGARSLLRVPIAPWATLD